MFEAYFCLLPVVIISKGKRRPLLAIVQNGTLRKCYTYLFMRTSVHRNLAAIQDREICCYSISCKEKDNIGKTTWGLYVMNM